MANTNVANFHMQYTDTTSQHWNPTSAKFAGADNLLTALERGWEIDHCVIGRKWYAGMRFVDIYEFKLRRGNDEMEMPVIHNPYIDRFIQQTGVDITKKSDTEAA